MAGKDSSAIFSANIPESLSSEEKEPPVKMKIWHHEKESIKKFFITSSLRGIYPAASSSSGWRRAVSSIPSQSLDDMKKAAFHYMERYSEIVLTISEYGL
ncbi:MAG: hypothetical protein RDV48_28910 [Candidatus Eremiobacteraeota bacterium]|nr:hypothetical protein [Candidatus Eremiobacteraeota bacterium]